MFEVYLVNKQINEKMNRRKSNPQGTNDKQKFIPSLKIPTTNPPLAPQTRSKLPTIPMKDVFMFDSMQSVF